MSMSLDACLRATDRRRPPSSASFTFSNTSSPPTFLPSASVFSASPDPITSLQQQSKTDGPRDALDHFASRSQAYSIAENAPKSYAASSSNDFDYSQPKRLQLTTSPFPAAGTPTTLPLPALPLPPLSTTSQQNAFPPHLPPLPLPAPLAQAAVDLRRLSSSHSVGSRPPTANSNIGLSPVTGRGVLPIGRRDSSHEMIPSRPPTSHSRRSSQASARLEVGAMENRRSEVGQARPKAAIKEATSTSAPVTEGTTSTTPSSPAASTTPTKSKRVRTGCLTCRERHLKCDEGLPDCLNCRKGNRECKRGLRLNFIDIQMKPVPQVPPVTEWNVSFLDESRLIASEYIGGVSRYPRASTSTPPRDTGKDTQAPKRRRPSGSIESTAAEGRNHDGVVYSGSLPANAQSIAVSSSYNSQALKEAQALRRDNPYLPNPFTQGNIRMVSAAFAASITKAEEGSGLSIDRDEAKQRRHMYHASDASSVASSALPHGAGPSPIASLRAEVGDSPDAVGSGSAARHGVSNTGLLNDAMPEGLPTPPSEKGALMRGYGLGSAFDDIYSKSGSVSSEGRDCLNSPDEILFMQVFVEEVGVWMDSFDREKHFSRIIPFAALKSPMLLNAVFACGVKHLTLVNKAYKDDKAFFYYDAATTQLLRNLQNPDRNIVECATTAVVLNVYEIMSEKPSERMSHIAGARALIRECGWDARSRGIGAACFWLNIGMEVLSCLAFNWQTAWDPEQWGLDLGFAHGERSKGDAGDDRQGDGSTLDSSAEFARRETDSQSHNPRAPSTPGPPASSTTLETAMAEGAHEEIWVHRIFYIVAKIANFRASIPRFQEPSPHDEQARLQARFSEWKQLKNLCDIWNQNCPRSMHPFSYIPASQNPSSASLFPNIWLIKRAAVVGRLFYHTAMVLLYQVNPIEPYDSAENQSAQRYHAHQVCGIVAHTKDRGVASVAIRSLAISALVLRDPREQDEVISLLEKITAETGWRIGQVYAELQQVWGRELNSSSNAAASSSPSTLLPPPSDLPPAGTSTISFASGLSTAPSTGFPALPLAKATVATANRRPLPGSSGTAPVDGPRHLRMHSTASVASNNSASVVATASSSTMSSPAMAAPMPYRPPQIMNPLLHADFSLPDHPYKAFYRPPNDSSHLNTQTF